MRFTLNSHWRTLLTHYGPILFQTAQKYNVGEKQGVLFTFLAWKYSNSKILAQTPAAWIPNKQHWVLRLISAEWKCLCVCLCARPCIWFYFLECLAQCATGSVWMKAGQLGRLCWGEAVQDSRLEAIKDAQPHFLLDRPMHTHTCPHTLLLKVALLIRFPGSQGWGAAAR